MSSSTFRVAAVQAMPVFLAREATVEKACDLIARAGENGARLVAFPEAFVPAYPDWVWAVPAGEDGILADMHAELVANSVDIPGSATDRLCEAAAQAGVYVVMGLCERNTEASGSSLYSALLYIDDHGRIMGKHRKLMPTGGERLVWTQGDGNTLGVYDTPLGKLGGLICWENYMPLARYAMYAWGVQIYVAATWDRSEQWLSTIRHIAKEGGVYLISVCMAMRKDDVPDRYAFKEKFYGGVGEWVNVGGSAIVNPSGDIIAGPVRMCEEILYAEVDPRLMTGPRWMLDVAGHYSRPDVFSFAVNTTPRLVITINSDQ